MRKLDPAEYRHRPGRPEAMEDEEAESLFFDLQLIRAWKKLNSNCAELMFHRHGQRNILRHEIFFFTWHAVIERPPVHGRELFPKVTMSGRIRDGPLQC